MTDINALVAEAQSRIRHGAAIRPGEALDVCNRLIAAHYTQRTKVAALEAEVERLRGALTWIGSRTDMTREDWTGLRGGDIESLHDTARQALGDTHDKG